MARGCILAPCDGVVRDSQNPAEDVHSAVSTRLHTLFDRETEEQVEVIPDLDAAPGPSHRGRAVDGMVRRRHDEQRCSFP